MTEQVVNLYDNAVAAAIYKDSQGKLMVCKTPFSNGKYSFPNVRIDATKAIVKFIEQIFEDEFGKDLEILDYYETTRIVYKIGNEYKMGNSYCYDFVEAGDYIGKPVLTPTPTGNYTDIQYKTVNQLIEMWESNQLEQSSFYYLLRYKERYSL